MEMIDKLKEIGILGDVRQRIGADDENDSSCDYRINQMSADRVIFEYCGWHLGDGEWWRDMKRKYDRICEYDKAPTTT